MSLCSNVVLTSAFLKPGIFKVIFTILSQLQDGRFAYIESYILGFLKILKNIIYRLLVWPRVCCVDIFLVVFYVYDNLRK